MYKRASIEEMQVDNRIEKLLKAIWFELVQLNKNLEKKENKI